MMLPSPMEKSEKAHHLLRKEVQQLTAKGYVINNWNHFVQDKLQGGAAYKIKKW